MQFIFFDLFAHWMYYKINLTLVISEAGFNWVKSYFINRTQFIDINEQSWALAPFFKNRSSLFALFFTMVHYRSFAPFGIFKVRSSLLRS